MFSLAKQLAYYQQQQKNIVSKVCNYVGIPLLVFSILLFFGWIHIRVPNLFDLSIAWLVTIALIGYSLLLDLVLGATLAVFLILINLLANYFSQPVPTTQAFEIFIVCFLLGLVLSLVSMMISGKLPNPKRALTQLLIAPLAIVADGYFCLGYKQSLQDKIANIEAEE